MQEQWKPIQGYEGIYEVSSLGEVRRLPSVVHRGGGFLAQKKGRIIKPWKSGQVGYLAVALSHENNQQKVTIHRLVCEAFNGPAPSPNHVVAHGDGNHLNNRADNLRWATQTDNNRDKISHGTSLKGAENHRAKLNESSVAAIRKMYANGLISGVKIAKLFNISPATVSLITRRKLWGHVA